MTQTQQCNPKSCKKKTENIETNLSFFNFFIQHFFNDVKFARSCHFLLWFSRGKSNKKNFDTFQCFSMFFLTFPQLLIIAYNVAEIRLNNEHTIRCRKQCAHNNKFTSFLSIQKKNSPHLPLLWLTVGDSTIFLHYWSRPITLHHFSILCSHFSNNFELFLIKMHCVVGNRLLE